MHQKAAVAAVGNYVLIAGGVVSSSPSNKVEIYDTNGDTWSLDYLR